MVILFLTQILPYPPDAGPRIKTWNVIRYLVEKGHVIHLASFVRREEEQHLEAVRELCESVHTVSIKRSRRADLAAWVRSQVSRRPFLVERDDTRSMTQLVSALVSELGIEAIHADQLTMAQYAKEAAMTFSGKGQAPLLIFDAHNAVWKIVERMKDYVPALLAPIIDLEARRAKSYEGEIVREFDRTLAVSEADRGELAEAGADGAGAVEHICERISVIPIGIDTAEWLPIKRDDRSANILAMGTLSYPPNADGIRWFASKVFPLIRAEVPRATLTIAGKNPPNGIQRLQTQSEGEVQVLGYVEDLTPCFEAAAIMVVPVRAGGGMRVRILEGFARGIPMVTTTLGLEGIDAEPTEEILVADTSSDFAALVVGVLEDRYPRGLIATNGRSLVERKYDWRIALSGLDEIYDSESKIQRTSPIQIHKSAPVTDKPSNHAV